MKIIRNLTVTALAALAVALLFLTQLTRAEENGRGERGDRDHRDRTSTFTKWVTTYPNMAGVVGGAVGDGAYAGEILKLTPGPITVIEALYHFNGSEHTFSALVHVEAAGSNPGDMAVITGVVTEGWMKGHSVHGGYTVITCDHDGVTTKCFEGRLEIEGE